MSSDSSKIPAWQEFEQLVEKLLALQGFEVEVDKDIGARQTDILARSYSGLHSVTLLVECKYSEEKHRVGVRTVEAFVQRLLNARHLFLADKGLLVSNCGFTRDARRLVEERGLSSVLELATPDGLRLQLLDFGPYLSHLVSSFENDELSSYIVDLSCYVTSPPTHDEIQALRGNFQSQQDFGRPLKAKTLRRLRKLEQDEEYDVEEEGMFKASSESYILRWLTSSKSTFLCVLGDYGTGKTTLCRYMGWLLAKKYMEKPRKSRLPIILPLRNFHSSGSARTFITDWLANECGIPSPRYAAFQEMLNAGCFTIFLDGFDEMIHSPEEERIHDAFRSLDALNANAGKLVLTGRPSFFPNLGRLNRAILQIDGPSYLAYRILPDSQLNRASPFLCLRLNPLTREQVVRVVENRRDLFESRGYTMQQLLEKIEEIYGFADLASRPVLLDVIVRTFAELGPAFSPRNTAQLYRIYTDLWIERERDKGEFRRQVTPSAKRAFMQMIAFLMFTTGELTIDVSDLPDVIQRVRGDEESAMYIEDNDSMRHMDTIVHDSRTCSFLSLAGDNTLRFYHKSFMEYFAACKLWDDIQAEETAALASASLSEEICAFLLEMISEDPETATRILKQFVEDACQQYLAATPDALVLMNRTYPSDNSTTGLLNALRLLHRHGEELHALKLDGLFLAGGNLDPGMSFAGARIVGLNLLDILCDRAIFVESEVKNSHWIRVQFPRMEADRLVFRSDRLIDCSFPGARLKDSRFVETTFEGGSLSDSDLRGSKFKNVILRDVSLRGSLIDGSTFTSCRFHACDLRGLGKINHASLSDVTFVSCIAEDAEHRNGRVP